MCGRLRVQDLQRELNRKRGLVKRTISREVEMDSPPEGMSKMQLIAWRKKVARGGVPPSPPGSPQKPTAAAAPKAPPAAAPPRTTAPEPQPESTSTRGAQAQVDALRTELSEATAGRTELETQLAATTIEMEAAQQALEAQRAAVISSAELEQGLQREMEEARVQIEELRRESTSATEAASDANARIEAMTEELAAASGRRVAASERLATMTGITSAAALPEAVPFTAPRQQTGILPSRRQFSSVQSPQHSPVWPPQQPPAGTTPPAMLLSPHRTTRSKLSIREYELILADTRRTRSSSTHASVDMDLSRTIREHDQNAAVADLELRRTLSASPTQRERGVVADVQLMRTLSVSPRLSAAGSSLSSPRLHSGENTSPTVTVKRPPSTVLIGGWRAGQTSPRATASPARGLRQPPRTASSTYR